MMWKLEIEIEGNNTTVTCTDLGGLIDFILKIDTVGDNHLSKVVNLRKEY